MSTSRLIIGLLVAAVLSILGRWYWLDQDPEVQGSRAASEPGAEQVIFGLNLEVLNDDGSRHFVLNTERLVQSAGDGSAVLDQPSFRLFRDNQSLWTATGNSAWLLEDGSEVRMDGNVQLRRSDDLHIESESMTFFPYDDRVRSDLQTTLTQVGGRMTGIGMRADLMQEIYRLLADVRGHYDAIQPR